MQNLRNTPKMRRCPNAWQRGKDQNKDDGIVSSRRACAGSRLGAALLLPHALNHVRDPLEQVAHREAGRELALGRLNTLDGRRRGGNRLVERARRHDAGPVGGQVEAASNGRGDAADGRDLGRAGRDERLQRAEGSGVGRGVRGAEGRAGAGRLGCRDGADGRGDGDDVGDDGDGLRARGAVGDGGGARRHGADRRGVHGRRGVGRDGGRRRDDGRVV
ncbi:uncharacterized protein J3D65DRAFT_55580 [Phyllosticta citribraziliensis]|uniref:Uncharacterized protein n=1 Tax=Phyllosticta citribraziliensis TaxID=989973 RepID=A0ABR1LC40_9PEZI